MSEITEAVDVTLEVIPKPPWYVGQKLTLKATIKIDSAPWIGINVSFDLLIYYSTTHGYSIGNVVTDVNGVALLEYTIPLTRNSDALTDNDIGFRAFENSTMTVSLTVNGHCYFSLPYIPLWKIMVVTFGAIAGGTAVYYVTRRIKTK